MNLLYVNWIWNCLTGDLLKSFECYKQELRKETTTLKCKRAREISFKNYNSWKDTYAVHIEKVMNYKINENNLWNGYESLKLNMKNGMESLLVFS